MLEGTLERQLTSPRDRMEISAWGLSKIPSLSEAVASLSPWAPESQRLFTVLVPSSVFQRAEQGVAGHLSTPHKANTLLMGARGSNPPLGRKGGGAHF